LRRATDLSLWLRTSTVFDCILQQIAYLCLISLLVIGRDACIPGLPVLPADDILRQEIVAFVYHYVYVLLLFDEALELIGTNVLFI
tara:strand:+ start:1359 stop:1616 length:258 start_codon:yes stop_codon:yes gene_type:complete